MPASLWEHGCIFQMLIRLCQRIHAVPPNAWQVVFSVLPPRQHAEQPMELICGLSAHFCYTGIRLRLCRFYRGEVYQCHVPAKRVFLWAAYPFCWSPSGRSGKLASRRAASLILKCFGGAVSALGVELKVYAL